MNSWNAELKATAPEVEPETEPPPDAEAAARELAKLSPLEYDRKRQAEADRLEVRVTTLDAEVTRHRGQSAGQPHPGPHSPPCSCAWSLPGSVDRCQRGPPEHRGRHRAPLLAGRRFSG